MGGVSVTSLREVGVRTLTGGGASIGGAALVLAAFAWLLSASLAQAEFSGPCAASINGVDLGGHDSSNVDAPIVIADGQDVFIQIDGQIDLNQSLVHVHVPLPGNERMLFLKTDILTGRTERTITETISAQRAPDDTGVDFDAYKNLGTGFYQLSVTGNGPGGSCSGKALIKLPGGLFDSKQGIISFVMVVVGGLGVAVSILNSALVLIRVGGRVIRGRERPADASNWWRPRAGWRIFYGLLGAIAGFVLTGGLVWLLQQAAMQVYDVSFTLTIIILGVAAPLVLELLALIERGIYSRRVAAPVE